MADQNHHTGDGLIPTLVSISCSIFAWVSLKDAQVIVSMCASGIAIVSGSMAVIYYYKKIKEK